MMLVQPNKDLNGIYRIAVLLFNDFTSPSRRLASPGAILLKPGGKPIADESKLCISARPGPPCPLA